MRKYIYVIVMGLLLATGCDSQNGEGRGLPESAQQESADWLLAHDWVLESPGLWRTETIEGGEIRFAETREAITGLCEEIQEFGFDKLEDSSFRSEDEFLSYCDTIQLDTEFMTRHFEPEQVEPEQVSICKAWFGATCTCAGGCEAGVFKCKCH